VLLLSQPDDRGCAGDVAERLAVAEDQHDPLQRTAWTHSRMVRCVKLNGAATDPAALASRPRIGE
jgi:hypothetical protein